MNNHRVRDQRRRGFGGDSDRPHEDREEPRYFQSRPSSSAAPETTAEVLWFNATKGFGFVKLVDGSEAFLHIAALEAAGHTTVAAGTKLRLRVGESAKGKQVTEVVEITGHAAPSPSPRAGPAAAPSGRHPATGPDTEQQGTVKWYNSEKGFGFISLDGGDKDAFVHATALARSGIGTLVEGQRVVVSVGPGQKGPEVRAVRLG